MYPFIQLTPTGLAPAADSVPTGCNLPGSLPDQFELAMKRELAKSPQALGPKSQPQEPARRQSRTRTPGRNISTPELPTRPEPSPNNQHGEGANNDLMTGREGRLDPSTPGNSTNAGAANVVTVSDAALAQALVAVPVLVGLPAAQPALRSTDLRVTDGQNVIAVSAHPRSVTGANAGTSAVSTEVVTNHTKAGSRLENGSGQPEQRENIGNLISQGHQELAPEHSPGSGPNGSPDGETAEGALDPSGLTGNEQHPEPMPGGPPSPDSSNAAPGAFPAAENAHQTMGALQYFDDKPPLPLSASELASALGTSAAQQDESMDKGDKVHKTADRSEQNLPGSGSVGATSVAVREGKEHFASSSPDSQVIAAATNTGTQDALASSSTSTSISDISGRNESRELSLERTHDLVAMHALRLTHSASDTLRVVIEPGGGTRLSLELRFHNGGIQAQALLHQGDFEFLNSHWADLQQRLEPRGIQLASLESSGHSPTDQQQSQQSGRQADEEPLARNAFARFAPDGSIEASPAGRRGRVATYDGWETWA